MFYFPVDLGQVQDYTAYMVLEQVRSPLKIDHHVRHIDRIPLGTPYTEQVRMIVELLRRPPLVGNVTLILDATGVGRPVVDMFMDSVDVQAPIVPIVITDGKEAHSEGQWWWVPKKDLVSAITLLLQADSLKIARGLALAKVLRDEMANFQIKISKTGHTTYEAGVVTDQTQWREGGHDDLFLALGMGCWYAQYGAIAPRIWDPGGERMPDDGLF